VYRFLLTPRWLGLALVVLVLFGAALRLGGWQFDRLDDRRVANAATRANLAAEPAPVGSVVSVGDTVGQGVEWRTVTATGTYDGDAQLYVRNQTREEGPGVSVVVPLVTADGQAVLVERGWLPTAGAELPEVSAAPSGEVSVTGWLRADSTAGLSATRPVEGTVRAIDSGVIADALGRELLPGYVALTEQVPAPDDALQPPVAPDLGQGPHFFYGLQWWFFALLALVGYVWFAWSEAHPKGPARRVESPTGVRA